jgi:hypothetical protein
LKKLALLAALLWQTACTGGGKTPAPTAGSTAAVQSAAGSSPASSKPRDLETYLVLIDSSIYETKIKPAFDKYVNNGEPGPVRLLLAGAVLAEDSSKPRRFEAAQRLSPAVMEAKCLVKLPGVEPYQLGPGELVAYLYSASDWLRETLTSKDISDIALDYPLGEITEIIRPTDAAEIRMYMRNVPAPEDAAIKKQHAALLTMMDAAAKNPKYALAMVMK